MNYSVKPTAFSTNKRSSVTRPILGTPLWVLVLCVLTGIAIPRAGAQRIYHYERNTARQLLFDDSDKLVGWCNRKSGEFLWTNRETNDYKPLAFSGIAIINPELPDLLPEADHPYPVVPEYLRLAKAHPIGCIQHDPQRWIDVGKPETLGQCPRLDFLQSQLCRKQNDPRHF